MRGRRGFVQLAILHLLQEQPMHGYQMMKELEERSAGTYAASAGTVYPALQELLDQEMIDLQLELDKKIYSLNQKGKERLEEFAKREEGDFWAEWKERLVWKSSEEATQLRERLRAWELELRKAMKRARMNKESAVQLIHLVDEMTERLRKDNK